MILILADDVGRAEIGAYGSTAGNTPNLDALAGEGIRLTSVYGTPKCFTSRAELMTGTYPFRMGFDRASGGHNLLPYPRIPSLLRAAGYETAIVGKWHLSPVNQPVRIEEFGFEYYRVWRHADRSGRRNAKYRNAVLETPRGEKAVGDTYTPDYLLREAQAFLTKERQRPFFLYYPLLLAHGPLHSADGKATTRSSSERFASMVRRADRIVASVLDTLRAASLEENTLVIFLADNGSPSSGGRGGKGGLTDDGVRLPCLMRWPGVIEAGRESDALIDFSDFLPTLAEVAGVELGTVGKLDGQSFLAHLRGEGPAPRDWVFVDWRSEYIVRDRNWRLDSGGRLYDLSAGDAAGANRPVPRSPDAAQAREKLEGILRSLGRRY